MSELVVGTRGSRLALAQAGWVAERLRRAHPAAGVRLEIIRTTGDAAPDAPLRDTGGKGLFTHEIELALLSGAVDLAVHSMKDLPTELPPALAFGAVPEREDVRDVLVSRAGGGLDALPPGARVGTGSPRRAVQLRARRPDLAIVEIRGNVDTRLRKLASDGVGLDAIVLAAAGLNRLGLSGCVTEYLDLDTMLPAVGQGALAVEVRAGDQRVLAVVAVLDDPAARRAVVAERAFLSALGGGCRAPVAAYASQEGALLRLRGMVANEDGSGMRRSEVMGGSDAAKTLGAELAGMLGGRRAE